MKRYIVSILIGIVPLFLSTACKERFEFEEQRSITIEASFSDDNTRADLEQASGSRDLITRWNEDDVIRLYLFQDGKGYTLDPVKVYNISSDGKRCSFGFKLPSDISLDHSYDIYGLCDAEGVIQEEESLVVAKSQLKRMHWNDRKVPMWFHSTGGNSSIQASFRHLGTYEVLHITNTSKLGVMFRHDGFDVETPWYKSYENTPLKDDYDPTQYVQEPGDDAQSGSVYLGAGQTEKYLSWYIPTGATINEATLLATIDGKTVSSVNTKSSSVRIQRGRAYHMYATWDGNELKFDKANELPDELGIGFTHLDMQEDGGYGFVTGREGYLRLESSDPSVATVSETDEIGEMHVEILAHSIGTAIITITDTNTGQKSQIEVVVIERTEFGAAVSVGETEAVTMKNKNGSFEAYSDDANIATCEVVGNVVYVTGIGIGETTIHVTDRNTNKKYSISVLVYGDGTQDIVPEAVDLGLPSGTKWAPYNVGAIKPEEVGSYFAWGETVPKYSYDWSSYKHAEGTDGTCHDIGSDISGTEYDVARQRWGQNWSMPTVEQVKELFMNSNISWKTQGNVQGVEVTSRINENSIFIPVSGVYSENEIYSSDRYCYYWTSIPKDATDRLANYFISYYSQETENAIWGTGREERCLGLPVRPVCTESEPNVPVPEAVDLGLPSGIKWASFNLGATKPEEYGDYYAWGEIEPYYSSLEPLTWKPGKEAGYDWPSYKWCMGTRGTLTKYCNNSRYGYEDYIDNKELLEPEDDAAFMNLGGKWRMPTATEFEELENNCTWIWITQNGVNGYSVSGPTGNSIFLPFAGSFYSPFQMSVANEGYEGSYWSSTHLPQNAWNGDCAYELYSSKSEISWEHGRVRDVGLPIRPVYDDSEPKPEIKTPEAVDLGLSVKWASFNLGATKPEEYGDYYAWGEIEQKRDYSYDSYRWSNGTSLIKYNTDSSYGTVDNKTILEIEDDVAHVKFGGYWRIPSKHEIHELISCCLSTWTIVNGVAGYKLTGPNGNYIFLPAAGYKHDSQIEGLGDVGLFHSSTLIEDDVWHAYSMFFNSNQDIAYGNGGSRYLGFTIRPVYDDSEPDDNPWGHPGTGDDGGDNNSSGGDDGLD